MLKQFLIIFFISSFGFGKISGQFIENPSFEGQPKPSTPPPGWVACNPFGTPDTQPGIWNVNTLASDGKTYISLITRGDNGEGEKDRSNEGIGTKLLTELEPSTCYAISLDLAYANNFNDLWYYPDWKPVKLQLWAGKSACAKEKLIWISPLITQTNWKKYSFNFTPDGNYSYLMIEAISDEGKYYNGNILIDNLKIEQQNLAYSQLVEACENEVVTLEAKGPYDHVLWWNGEVTARVDIKTPGDYQVYVFHGNCVTKGAYTVNYLQPLKVTPDADTTICLGDNIELMADDGAGNSYLWSTGSAEQSITIDEAGVYKVQINNFCEAKNRSFIVDTKQCCIIEIPNVFSPNNDGLNDIFQIETESDLVDFSFEIYNRWGNNIHESNDPVIIWRGQINGEDAPAGVYYWTSSFQCRENGALQLKKYRGFIHLLR